MPHRGAVTMTGLRAAGRCQSRDAPAPYWAIRYSLPSSRAGLTSSGTPSGPSGCHRVSNQQEAPRRIRDPDVDPEPPGRLVVPLPDIRHAREQQREPEPYPGLVEALLARAQPEPAVR